MEPLRVGDSGQNHADVLSELLFLKIRKKIGQKYSELPRNPLLNRHFSTDRGLLF